MHILQGSFSPKKRPKWSLLPKRVYPKKKFPSEVKSVFLFKMPTLGYVVAFVCPSWEPLKKERGKIVLLAWLATLTPNLHVSSHSSPLLLSLKKLQPYSREGNGVGVNNANEACASCRQQIRRCSKIFTPSSSLFFLSIWVKQMEKKRSWGGVSRQSGSPVCFLAKNLILKS